jgi:hypothetical protein
MSKTKTHPADQFITVVDVCADHDRGILASRHYHINIPGDRIKPEHRDAVAASMYGWNGGLSIRCASQARARQLWTRQGFGRLVMARGSHRRGVRRASHRDRQS